MIISFNRYNGGGGSGSGVTPQQVQAQIDSALTPYWDSAITESAITEAVAGKADAKILVDFDHTTQAERATLYAELKALYDGGSGATINKNYDFYKTVNTWQGQKIDYYTFSGDTLVFGQVVSPENLEDQVAYVQVMEIDSVGNVTVQTNTIGAADMSGYYTSAQTEEAITSKNYVVSGQVKTQIEAYNYVTSAETEAQILSKNYTTSAETKTYVDSAVTGVQDQIDTLDEVVSQAILDLNDRVDEISAATPDLSNYWTSAQTEDAISAATSGKADAANIQAHTGGIKFPLWNSQGIITGPALSSYWFASDFKLNGSGNEQVIGRGTFSPFYAPVSAGTAGEILVSTGSGAPVWSAATQDMVTSTDVRHIVKLTQAAYDQLVLDDEVDPYTFYIIVSQSS